MPEYIVRFDYLESYETYVGTDEDGNELYESYVEDASSNIFIDAEDEGEARELAEEELELQGFVEWTIWDVEEV